MHLNSKTPCALLYFVFACFKITMRMEWIVEEIAYLSYTDGIDFLYKAPVTKKYLYIIKQL